MPDAALHALHQLQFALTAHLREPERHPPPGDVPPERLALYRELLYHNVESFLAASFPVLRASLDPDQWQALAEGFFREHRSKSPYPGEIGEEFLQYLQQERANCDDDPAYLLELAHYEWVELALMIGEAEVPDEAQSLLQDPWNQRIVLSELAWPLAYRFPVQRIGPAFNPIEPPTEATLLLVYRGRDDRVRFLEVGVLAYRLLVLLQQQGPLKGWAAFEELTAAGSDPSHQPQVVELLRDLAARGIIGLA
jgi:uncharacterized protein